MDVNVSRKMVAHHNNARRELVKLNSDELAEIILDSVPEKTLTAIVTTLRVTREKGRREADEARRDDTRRGIENKDGVYSRPPRVYSRPPPR